MVKLLRKDLKFNWDESCQKAFDKLKEILYVRNQFYLTNFTISRFYETVYTYDRRQREGVRCNIISR